MAAVTVAAVGVGASLIGGAVSAHQGKQAAKGARNDAARTKAEMDAIRAARQPITNPYASTKDVSGMAKDLSGMITNPYANLGVATQAAEMQAEEADIALANTLDTLRATGASAGGATALAQAALQSKKSISASIEQQEAANEKLRAQGEIERNQMKMAEQQRLQSIQISEAQRVQGAEAAGKQFMFAAQEDRTNADLGQQAGALTQAMQNQASAQAAQGAAWGGAISGVGSALGGLAGSLGGSGGGSVASEIASTGGFSTIGGGLPAAPSAGVGYTFRSDRRLKENIKKIGISPKGLNIYSFEYKHKNYGQGVFQGVMSDEVPSNVIVKDPSGYDAVDYSLIDVEFKKL
jgi:hypothetical protein